MATFLLKKYSEPFFISLGLTFSCSILNIIEYCENQTNSNGIVIK